MKEEYKAAIEEISLSGDDRARILANVLKAYEQTATQPLAEDAEHTMPEQAGGQTVRSLRISPRRLGAVAAAFIVLCVSVVLIRGQYITVDPDQQGGRPGSTVTAGASWEVVWEEYDSVDDIAEKTDCRTYTLGNLSGKYKVKKVEVANAQRHVKITYQNKKEKEKDKIYFEYKEEADSEEIKSQFLDENEISTEKIDGSDVKMYGEKKCSGMTWEDSDCTFAVKMSKARSTDSARKIVSGTKEKKKEDSDDQNQGSGGAGSRLVNSNIVGWDGSEKASGDKEKNRILNKIYDLFGFRVLLHDPAVRVTYKCIGEFESFAFYHKGEKSLEDKWIIGYAGQEGSPGGVMEDYDEVETMAAGETEVAIYQRDIEEKLLVFTREDICFTLFLDDYEEDLTREVLTELLSVFEISFEGETDQADKPDNDKDDGDEEDDPKPDNDSKVDCYEAAQKLQSVVAEKNLKKLASYIRYPLKIEGLGVTVSTKADFLHLDAEQIFTPDWIDAILFCDIESIKPSAKSFTLGDSDNSLVCKVKDGAVVVTELHVVADEEEENEEEDPVEDLQDIGE